MTEHEEPRAASPAPDPHEALAARPLLEQVARLADRIGQHTVGEITVLSDRAAAWLAENPPGQPVAIEPRGCPTPGACSCVQPPAPAPGEVLAADFQSLQGLALDMIEALRPIVIPEILGVLRKAITTGQPERARALVRAAEAPAPAPVPVPVAERPWERPGWCDAEGKCWWQDPRDAAWWWTKCDPRMVHVGWLLPHWALCHRLLDPPPPQPTPTPEPPTDA